MYYFNLIYMFISNELSELVLTILYRNKGSTALAPGALTNIMEVKLREVIKNYYIKKN